MFEVYNSDDSDNNADTAKKKINRNLRSKLKYYTFEKITF